MSGKPSAQVSTKPISEMSEEEWFHALHGDAFDAMLDAKRRGDMTGAKNAIADMYLAADAYLKDDSAAVWAYLFDWAGDVTHALLDKAEQEEAATP